MLGLVFTEYKPLVLCPHAELWHTASANMQAKPHTFGPVDDQLGVVSHGDVASQWARAQKYPNSLCRVSHLCLPK